MEGVRGRCARIGGTRRLELSLRHSSKDGEESEGEKLGRGLHTFQVYDGGVQCGTDTYCVRMRGLANV